MSSATLRAGRYTSAALLLEHLVRDQTTQKVMHERLLMGQRHDNASFQHKNSVSFKETYKRLFLKFTVKKQKRLVCMVHLITMPIGKHVILNRRVFETPTNAHRQAVFGAGSF